MKTLIFCFDGTCNNPEDVSDFFDDESQDNIHDLILFIIFGVFMIFVLDTIYRLGKRN